MAKRTLKQKLQNRIFDPLLMYFYNTVVKGYIKLFGAKDKRELKYKVSACLIFKDEGPFLKEWLDYHLTVGIDHFYLYDNNSTDNYREIIQPYIDREQITLVPWPHQQAQAQAYKHCLETYRTETNWITFIDADEFIVPRYEADIKAWIRRFEKYPAIVIQWLMFGTNGKLKHDYNQNVIEQYHACWEQFYRLGKCIVNTRYNLTNWDTQYFHHHAYMRYPVFGCNLVVPAVNQWGYICRGSRIWGGKGDKMAHRNIQINHYYTKAWDIYQSKMNKSDVFFTQNPKNLKWFYERDMKCISRDYTIERFFIKMKNSSSQANK